MDRRQFVGWSMAAGTALPLLGRIAFAQPTQGGSVDYDAILDELLSELEAVGAEKRETVGGADFTAEFRSVLDQKQMKADFPTPPLTPEFIAGLRLRRYWDIPTIERPAPVWPAFARAPDYSHLTVLPLKDAAFTLSAGVLRLLAQRNAFDLSRTSRPVIAFGLRGCRIASGALSETWAKDHALVVATPSHVSSECVIGLWRTADDSIAVYRGSTVPAVAHMYMSLAERGDGASLLPTGLYAYGAGTHLANKPRSIQRGALRIAGSYVVLRTAKDLSYDPYADTTAWTRGIAHNLHAGGAADLFSCAGCQVIPGGYSGEQRLKVTGEWSSFQKAAGLVGEDGAFIAADESPTFLYMLLTGYEAALAFHGGSAFDIGYRRLRPGSTGSDVVELQKRLLKDHPAAVPGLKADGGFGMRTSFAVLIEQEKQTGEYTYPIVSI